MFPPALRPTHLPPPATPVRCRSSLNVVQHGTAVPRQASVVSLALICDTRGRCRLIVSRARSVVFLLHIALDVPMAIQGLWSPLSLPFLQLNNTTIVFIKVRCCLPTGAKQITEGPCSCTPHSSPVRASRRYCALVSPVSRTRPFIPCHPSDVDRQRILAWETRSGHRALHLPCYVLHRALQRAAVHSSLVRSGC